MSAAAAPNTRAGRLAARLAATKDRLADVSLPESGAWLARARSAAMDRVKAMGLPGKRDEYWRFTDPTDLLNETAKPAEVFQITDEPEMFMGIDRLKIVFIDGVFSAEESDDIAGEGLEIARLSEIAQTDIHWAQDLYGTLEADGQAPVERPMAALNTARATDGLVIRATGVVSKPVSLIYKRGTETADVILHHVVRVEAGGELTLLENGPGAARFSIVTEIELADDACLHHVRAMGRDHQRRAHTHIFARLGARSRFKSFTLAMNGALVRNEAMIWLNGENGVAHLAGAALGDGVFHHDDTVFVTHAAPGCESRQVFKKVLHHGAVGVFQGKILVKQPAQLTDGYQLSQSLLMDDASQFLAKPELEIYADDVKCSHGSTSGEIDADHLFYLRARGIPEDVAKQLLILAFLAEAIDEIERQDVAEGMQLRLQRWLNAHTD